MISSLYDRLFVKFYGWSLKVDGPSGTYTVLYASLSLSLMLLINLASLVVLLDLLFGWPLMAFVIGHSVLWVVAVAVAIAAFNVLHFRHRRRYKKLVTSYAGSEKALAAEPYKALIAYMVLSYVLFVALVFVSVP